MQSGRTVRKFRGTFLSRSLVDISVCKILPDYKASHPIRLPSFYNGFSFIWNLLKIFLRALFLNSYRIFKFIRLATFF
jgi:hypothetical protein